MGLKFDSPTAHLHLVDWKATGICPTELIKMFNELLDSLTTKSKYINYPSHVKDDMKSEAIYQFLKYSHNYNPDKIKSKNGAFTFLCFNAENAYKKVIKSYYKHINLKELLLETSDNRELLDNYVDTLSDNREDLKNWQF